MVLTSDRWGVEWHSVSQLVGDDRHIIWNDCSPLWFWTRKEARAYIKERYGYIAGRPDLRAEPHGWKMPRAVKIRITVERCA